MKRNETIALFIFGIVFALVMAGLLILSWIDIAQAIQIIITFILVCVTAIYVKRTAEIADATKKQAEASVKMAEEMKEQRIIASRPIIVQRAMYETIVSNSPPAFTYFEIFNIGNGPAIEVDISVFNKDKKRISSQKRSFFHASESIKFYLDQELTTYIGSTWYLVSEYQSIYSRSSQTWYQSKLPFEIKQISGTDKIILLPDNLELLEVYEKDRIDAFGSRSKPK